MRREIFLENLFYLSHVPIHVYSHDGERRESYEKLKRTESLYETNKRDEMLRHLREECFWFLQYDEDVPLGICGCRGEEFYYILGPFAVSVTDTTVCRRFMKRHQIGNVAECRYDDILLAANMILNEYSGEEYTVNDLKEKMYRERMQSEVGKELVYEELRQFDAFQENHAYVEEEVLWNSIEEGDVEWLRKHYAQLIPDHPIILDDEKKSEEYMAAAGITIAARAAIRGGLISSEAFLINDIYLRKLYACTDVREIQELQGEAFLYYAEQVRRKKSLRTENRHVEECKKDIIARRREKIDLQKIADDVGISKEYMQKLFKQHEGIPITEYIINIKLEAGCNMLKYSDRQVNEIAEYLGFGSVSYFSDIFKQRLGISPTKYRQKNQQPNF